MTFQRKECMQTFWHAFPWPASVYLRTPATYISRGTISEVRARARVDVRACLSVLLLFCERNILSSFFLLPSDLHISNALSTTVRVTWYFCEINKGINYENLPRAGKIKNDMIKKKWLKLRNGHLFIVDVLLYNLAKKHFKQFYWWIYSLLHTSSHY